MANFYIETNGIRKPITNKKITLGEIKKIYPNARLRCEIKKALTAATVQNQTTNNVM